jgi:hypothetical protein
VSTLPAIGDLEALGLADRPDPSTDLVLLANDAMRARRVPGRIALLWLWELFIALVVTWPIVAMVSSVYGRHPQGDGPLWNRGAHELLDLWAHTAAARAPIIVQAALVFATTSLVGLIPTGMLLASIGYTTRSLRPPPLHEAMARALAAFRPMAAMLIFGTLAQGAVLGAFAWLGSRLASGLDARYGEAPAEQLGLAAAAVGLAAAAVVGVTLDLSRAAAIRFRAPALHALGLGWRAFRATPATLCWSWAWRGLAAAVPIVFGSLVAERLGGRGGTPLLALTLVHQAIVLSRAALRTSWLAKALRTVDAAGRPSSSRQA